MAVFDTIEVSYNRRVQLDQFEPVELGASAVLTLEPDDEVAAVYEHAQAALQSQVERSLAERVARARLDETGPSVPAIKAVIREQTDVLSAADIEALAESLADAGDE